MNTFHRNKALTLPRMQSANLFVGKWRDGICCELFTPLQSALESIYTTTLDLDLVDLNSTLCMDHSMATGYGIKA